MKTLIPFLLSFLPVICPAQTLEEVLSYGLPVVVVSTVNNEEPTAERVIAPEGCLGKSITNATKVPSRLRIYYPGNAENPVFDSGEYVENESGMIFKLRGNTSAMRAKNPFKVKLQRKADLLMRDNKMYKDKDWALIKPTGGSILPCPIVMMLGNKVSEILHVADWVPAFMNVNLIVNDNYRGFYQLTETVKRNERCRINVDETSGFIFELDPYWWNEDVSVESSLISRTSKAYKFTFKYPDSDDITDSQLAAFKEFIDLFDDSIEKGGYPLLIDVESCARWLLAHQLLGTLDSAGSNMFFIRHDNHSMLEMGPLWDFDSILQVSGTWTPIMRAHYFKWMLQSPSKLLAREMTRIWTSEKEQIMAEIESFCESLAGSELTEAIDKSIAADFQRWHQNQLDDMQTTIQKIKSWFPARAMDLDNLVLTLDTIDGDISYDPNSVNAPTSDSQTGTRKVVKNGHLYIIRGGETYSLHGYVIKPRCDNSSGKREIK